MYDAHDCDITYENEIIGIIVKKNYFIAFILGLICSFGYPAFSYVLLSLCSLALFLYLLIDIKTAKQATWFSFSFGYGYYLYSHHWFNESLLAYGNELLWLMPFGLLLIPAFFAMYFALAGYLINSFAKDNIFIIALIWLAMEFTRSYAYIEFPWLLIGYIWSFSDVISQSVAVFSIWGLSFLSIIWMGAIYAVIQIIKDKNYKNYYVIIVAFISFVACHIYGYHRLNNPPSLVNQDVNVRVVQANLDKNIYSRINNRYENLMKHISLSEDAREKDIDYIIWPEGSHEYNLDRHLLNKVKYIIPPDGGLIFNSTRREKNSRKHWNSLFLVDHLGEIIDYHDKIHLVVLGEFIPFRTILPFINKITPGGTDYSPGKKLKALDPRHPFLPSICYEATFPDTTEEKFTWIVNITNDGWFGSSIGPYQHLAISKFRSIEQGVPMVRASLTGVSAIIDSFGRIMKHLPLLTEGILDSSLPAYVADYTYYRKYGYYSVICLMLIIYGFSRLTNRIFRL